MSKKNLALLHCANYNRGKCSGVLFVRSESGNQIGQMINSDYENKECFIDKGCEYYDKCVRPIIV